MATSKSWPRPAEGVRSANADVVIKRVPDTMSPEVAKQHGAKLEQEAPFATPDEVNQLWLAIKAGIFAQAHVMISPREPCPFDRLGPSTLAAPSPWMECANRS